MAVLLPPAVAVPRGLTIFITVFSALSMAVWGTSIGFLFGMEYNDIAPFRMLLGMSITIPTNAAIIYFSCRLIFIIMNSSFPRAESLQDLQQCVAGMVAVTVIGFSAWVTSVVWLVFNPHKDFYIVYHACNYGYVLSAVVAGLAGGILQVISRKNGLPITNVPRNHVTQHAQVSQAHYNPPYFNQAYAHHDSQQSM